MRLDKPNCPECGEPAYGTVERLSGVAKFVEMPAQDTNVEYSGWTEIWWDEQRTAHQHDDQPEGPRNLPLVCCEDGHEWPTRIDWNADSESPAKSVKTRETTL